MNLTGQFGNFGSKPTAFAVFGGCQPSILLVDGDPLSLDMMLEMLGEEQYDISMATHVSDALEQLHRTRYDLVIADVKLPDGSGYGLTRTIRKRYSLSELPVLLISAGYRSEDLMAGLLAGANDCVTKPVDALVLKARVRALIVLKRSVEDRLRMEGAWLHAQIQPHFMYNTLNAIASLGTSNTERMLDLLEAFGNYLRMSFDFQNTSRVVPLKHELNLVRSYLYIEEQRFGQRLKVKWDLDADMDLMLPPLSIQMLVENALHNGILCRAQGGKIVIRLRNKEQCTEITVEDDGIGMSEDTWQQLLQNPASTAKRGIGLRNTDDRLKQLFGKGLTFVSTPETGTAVSFQIPHHWT